MKKLLTALLMAAFLTLPVKAGVILNPSDQPACQPTAEQPCPEPPPPGTTAPEGEEGPLAAALSLLSAVLSVI